MSVTHLSRPLAVVTLTLKEALELLLDQVDYKARACRPFESVGAVLNEEVIDACRAALIATDSDLGLVEWRGKFWRVADANAVRLETLLGKLAADQL